MTIISYAQNFEDVMLWRALGHIDKGFYIDIGAQHPIIDSVSRAFYDKGWRGISVEANPVYATLLREDRPDEMVIEAAVNDARGVMTFYQVATGGLSTGKQELARGYQEKGMPVREITVPCVTLADLFEQADRRDVHWLKIDVEGMEPQALRGWGRSKARPWIVVVESTLPNTQTETQAQWEALLSKKGYTPVFFDGLNRYYLSSRQPQLAAAFKSGPNVFDDFQLNGTACAPFCTLVNERHAMQTNELNKLLQAEQQKAQAVERDWEQQARTLNERSSQIRIELEQLQRILKQQEQDFNQQLQAERLKHQAIVMERDQHEKVLNERATLARAESDSVQRSLKQQVQDLIQQLQAEQRKRQAIEMEREQHEKDLNEQLALARAESDNVQRSLKQQVQDLIQQAQTEQRKRQAVEVERDQHEKALNEQHALVRAESDSVQRSLKQQVQDLIQQLQVEQQKRQAADLEREQREREAAGEILYVQQQAEREIARQTLIHTEQIHLLQLNHANREAMLLSQLQAAQQKHSNRMHIRNHHGQLAAEGVCMADTMNENMTAAKTLDELLSYHNEQFIRCAYQTLLGRGPDLEGMRVYLAQIGRGIRKIEILAQLRFSEEGKARNVKIAGLHEAITRYKWLRPFSQLNRMVGGFFAEALGKIKANNRGEFREKAAGDDVPGATNDVYKDQTAVFVENMASTQSILRETKIRMDELIEHTRNMTESLPAQSRAIQMQITSLRQQVQAIYDKLEWDQTDNSRRSGKPRKHYK